MSVLTELASHSPDEARATAEVPMRYEDITQDGRVRLEAFSPALGEVVWKKLLSRHPGNAALRAQGIVPILTRLVLEGEGGPFGVGPPLTGTGTFELSHTASKAGDVERILLRMWVDMTMPVGRTHGPPPENAGAVMLAGRAFAEHVLTRPFGAAEDRKVLRLDGPGLPGIPAPLRAWSPLADIVNMPDDAKPLEAAASADATVTFGLCHTDSNQHVNSLVYPRLFEDAALRRFAALGHATPVLARFLEVGYRKPFFAGDRAKISLQAFAVGDRLGAIGAFTSETDARPHAFLRMMFDR